MTVEPRGEWTAAQALEKGGRCARCPVRAIGLCCAIGPAAACELERIGHCIRLPEGRQISGPGEKSRTFSIIVSGVAKLVAAHGNGERQIVGLQFASDFVGRPFDPASGNVIAEAATDVELCSFSGSAFEGLLATHPDLERALLGRVLKDLDMARDWLFLLGRKTAEEKVATFLMMLYERMRLDALRDSTEGDLSRHLRLPLSRSEIAECLSLRLETVSRQFATLKARGILETRGRRNIIIRDMAGLQGYLDSASKAA